MKQIAIAGVGLIGSSFALAVRQAGFDGELVGISSARSIAAGIEAGAISRGVSLEEAAAVADLIYLSQPIEQILQTLSVLGPIAREDCLITDAGSTKSTIVETAARYVTVAPFLGGHPLAGKEARGAEAADPNLFRGRPYVLTPTAESDLSHEFRAWLERIGAQVCEMTPFEHDQTVALTSHLPQLISTALAAMLGEQDSRHINQVFGPGLLDMTRLALSAPEVWLSVLRTNGEAVKSALSYYRATIEELQSELDSGGIEHFFALGAKFATAIRNKPSPRRTRD